MLISVDTEKPLKNPKPTHRKPLSKREAGRTSSTWSRYLWTTDSYPHTWGLNASPQISWDTKWSLHFSPTLTQVQCDTASEETDGCDTDWNDKVKDLHCPGHNDRDNTFEEFYIRSLKRHGQILHQRGHRESKQHVRQSSQKKPPGKCN